MPPFRTIGVIGAGIAGLTAAGELAARGHRAVIFEQAGVPGGRSATHHVFGVERPRRGVVDLAFDHGAQYFTVRDARFAETVAQWRQDGLVAQWPGRIVSFDGEGWEDVAPGTDRHVGVPDMGAIGRCLARHLDVRYGTRVTRLMRTLNQWAIFGDAESPLGMFDSIVLAIPAPQAVPLLQGAPALAARAAGVAMKPCWTALAAFDEPVPARFDAAFVSGSPLGWVARNQSKPRRDRSIETWVLQASHEWSAAHLTQRADSVGPFLADTFETLVRGPMPRPFSLTTHRWRFALADPPLFVAGPGELFEVPGENGEAGGAGVLHDASLGLAVCGDWCAGSRIEGAYLSGQAAARVIATY